MEESIKKELVKIFNGIPIEADVKEIITKTTMDFEYQKIPIPLTRGDFTEKWQSDLENYEYLSNHSNQVTLSIIKEFSGDVKCYEISIRLQYNNEELMEKDFDMLKTILIEKGAILEESNISGKFLPAKFKNGLIDLGTEGKESKFSFSIISDTLSSNYQMALVMEQCLD